MKSFDESCVENCEIILIEEYPCQNKKQPEKKEGEYIGNDKSRLWLIFPKSVVHFPKVGHGFFKNCRRVSPEPVTDFTKAGG